MNFFQTPPKMSRPVTVLITGLTMKYSKTMNPGMDAVAFGKTLDDSVATLKSVKNLYHHRFELDPSTPSEHPESTDSLKRFMRQGPPQGGTWDAHIIGVGVRRMPQLTDMFEDIVNAIISSSGGNSKVLFLQRGDDHLECVKRAFPELEVGGS